MSIQTKAAQIFRETLTRISPTLNTKVLYRVKFGRKINLKEPKTFNEKCLWLKLNTYYNNPLIKQCADKFAVRQYISDKGYENILNTLYGSYTDPEKINWDGLPQSFALKLNVGCGKNIIVSDKSKLNIKETMRILEKWLKPSKAYLGYSEMQYKDVTPIIMIEKYLGELDGSLPTDYKFFCMNGICHAIVVCVDRESNGFANYFFMDKNWEILPITSSALTNKNKKISRPENLQKAISIAEKLSEDFPQVRVDLYIKGASIYFGELTFTTCGAMWTELNHVVPGTHKSIDEVLGEYIILPTEYNKTS